MKILPLTKLGNPILRKPAKQLTPQEILSDKIQTLIQDMKYTCQKNNYGVGLSAPQVGKSLSLIILGIKPTPNRPNLKPFEKILINTEILDTFGKTKPMWEACCSIGGSTNDSMLYAKVPRYRKIRIQYLDENATEHTETVEGFTAQVIQHETDHLAGILFLDRVTDPKTYMLGSEYKKRIVKKTKP
jgi:peptide deformylase